MDWGDLTRELDFWLEEGRVAQFWWRDDDAAEPLPALARLLDLAAPFELELGLAVVPQWATEALAEELRKRPHVAVLQHGFAHVDHGAGGRAVECGGVRATGEVLAELRAGGERLQRLFGGRFANILAPPWNRIDPKVAVRLEECGFAGLSTFGPRAGRPHPPGMKIVNAHVDPLDWRRGGRFAGEAKALSGIIGELRARRTRMAEADEPLGLLTHHLKHDADAWEFLAHLLETTHKHAAADWLGARAVFASAAAESAGTREI
jgi:hypothetical protein